MSTERRRQRAREVQAGTCKADGHGGDHEQDRPLGESRCAVRRDGVPKSPAGDRDASDRPTMRASAVNAEGTLGRTERRITHVRAIECPSRSVARRSCPSGQSERRARTRRPSAPRLAAKWGPL